MTTAALLDQNDELVGFAKEFAKPPGVYMDGNSLGLMCRAAEESLHEAIEMWRTLAIRGWTEGTSPWFSLARAVSAQIAPLLGCDASDVMVGNSTTVNLHQILATFSNPARSIVVMDGAHFPTDRYAVDSYLRTHGFDPSKVRIVAPGSDRLLDEDHLIQGLADVRISVFPAVVYTTGQLIDMQRVSKAAHGHGVLIAWDCSHSAGVIPHRFRDHEIDLAFGCGYKYLNGGPGAPAWLYVHPRLQDRLPGLAGWFGCDPSRQFEMSDTFYPATDAGRFQIGTPHVLSLAPMIGSLRVLNEAGIERIRAKSLAQTQFLREYGLKTLTKYGVGIVTPRDPNRRGGHVTFTHPEAAKLSQALRKQSVVPDFRPPDMLRFAPAPLYTSFAECQAAVDTLATILSNNAHLELADSNALVT